MRSVALHNETVAVLDASTGVVLMDQSFSVTKEITIDSDFGGDFSKRTLDISDDKIVVSEAQKAPVFMTVIVEIY